MGDNEVIDITQFLHQRKFSDLEIQRQEFYAELKRADYDTFKSGVLAFFQLIAGGLENVDTQIKMANDNFLDIEKSLEKLNWCVDKLVEHVAR